MTVAARQIDWEAWSQSRFLAWAETQPEGCRYEFDGFRPVAMAPATVGYNRIGRNIREAIHPRLPAGAPCDTYGPQDAIETVGGALREPDAFIACSRPHRNAVAVPAPIVVFEVVSPGRGNRRRDEEKIDEYESVPSILRYVVVESESRSFCAFWREPGEQAWRRDAVDTAGPIRLPEFGIELTLDEVYAGSTSIEAGGCCGRGPIFTPFPASFAPQPCPAGSKTFWPGLPCTEKGNRLGAKLT
jgi:Uma2 family endonuclease